MKRGLAALFVWLLAFFAVASGPDPVLVLIEPAAVDRSGSAGTESFGIWVRWPSRHAAKGNQLLSLVTGMDWQGDAADYGFRPAGKDTWKAENLPRLQARGHFEAKSQTAFPHITPLTTSSGVVRDLLLMGVEADGLVRTRRQDEPWPEDHLMVAKVREWQDLAGIEAAAPGPVLVLEYPPREGTDFSRAWLRGRGWSIERPALDGVERPWVPSHGDMKDIPGLLAARDLTSIFTDRRGVTWSPPSDDGWPDLGPWIDYARVVGFETRLVIGVSAVIFVVWGLRLVSDERRSRPYGYSLYGLFLILPGVLVAGTLIRTLGFGWRDASLYLAMGGLLGLAFIIHRLVRRRLPNVHPLWSLALVAMGATCLGDPVHSAFSGPLGSSFRMVSPEWIGSIMAAGAVLVAGAEGRLRWIARFMVLMAVAATLKWMVLAQQDLLFACLPFTIFVGLMRQFRLWMATLLWPFTSGFRGLCEGGVAFSPLGLIARESDAAAFNLAPLLQFFISPAFLIGLLVAVCAAVFTPSFAVRQLRRVWRQSPFPVALMRVAGILTIVGVFQPPLLDVAYLVAVAAFLMLLCEAAWSSDTLR